jgi:large subunit ribosomal protein L25
MIALEFQVRNTAEKVALLRKQGFIPGVLYGPKTKNQTVQVDAKLFQKVYHEAGESSLINLQFAEGTVPVLIRQVQREPLRGSIIHVDFYQPALDEEIEVPVVLVFEGEAPAVKDLGGTLLRNIQELEVRALPQNLPHELVVDISKLATFEDKILVQDVVHESTVEILREPDEVIAQVVEAEDVEAELEESVQENVEAVASDKPEKEVKEEEGDPK